VFFLAFLVILSVSSPVPAVAAGPVASQPVEKLRIATAKQSERFALAFGEVNQWIDQKAFPGAVLEVGQHGQLIALQSFGKMESQANARPMPVDAIFDLASLSKVIGTTTAAEVLYDRGRLDLDAPVTKYIPEFAGTPGHDKILVRHLLTHSSGLNSREVLWKQAHDRQGIMELIYKMPLEWEPGSRMQYRDYNMILMGEIVYRITGQRLDKFLAKNVFKPLGMKDTGYNPSPKRLDRIPPTEQDDVFRHQLVHGAVHDENAALMGGVSGHAGLFSSVGDLAKLAQMYLNGGTYGGKRIVSKKTIDLFMRRQLTPAGTSRGIGWDTAVKGSFAGDLASPKAIVHTGFTGTSIYIDPDRDLFIILLTNRVNPTRNNMLISKARPAIHTAVLKVLDQDHPEDHQSEDHQSEDHQSEDHQSEDHQ
jgi:CubicO group peptidase (beta-lactamase class C family)